MRFPVRLDDTAFDGGFGYRLALLQWINGSAADVARSILDELGSRRHTSAADGLLDILSRVVRSGYETDDQALDAARQETRRYAKRQLTWFRNQTPDWQRISAP